ncbi:MAG: hypothetical protein A2882_09400 [Phenylobacterium sp. RIFCSPHIGHO2_01_FULL_70_10]|nr:MAG: hypothetical protein A2882_09400 [Phenylobacterium sp. RIFCSPHIGHO2_01_FULL_70_10]
MLPDELYDYYTQEPAPKRGRPPSRAVETWRVIDDWPARVPVTEAEVDVFEAWFGDLFDELFGPAEAHGGLLFLSQTDKKDP